MRIPCRHLSPTLEEGLKRGNVSFQRSTNRNKHGTMLQIVKLGDGEKKERVRKDKQNHINCKFYLI